MPKEMQQEVKTTIAQIEGRVSALMPEWTQVREPAAFLALEQAAHDQGRQLADALVALVLRQIIDDSRFAAECVTQAAATKRYRPNCRRTISVTLLGGTTHNVHTP